MPNSIKLNDWSIAYSPYVDTLHVYKNAINKKAKEDLIDKDYGKFHLIVDSKDSQMLLFVMKQASKNFRGIDNMDKEHIILRVKELVRNYG